MTENNKVYGLILPKKVQAKENKAKASTFNVFGDESDEEEAPKGPVGPYGQTKSNTKMKRQTQMDIEKALLEDPSVYEYDNIYDDMQAAKPKVGGGEKNKVAKARKPKYIAELLKASEEKKKEDERRKERQVQKEREAEGEKFADKESFVTSAYKKKMLEMQEDEEKEKRKAEMEALTDVTKQKDMSGFYRYLYRQTTGPEVKPEVKSEVKPEVKQESDSGEGIEGESSDRTTELLTKLSDIPAQVKEEPASPAANRSRSSSSSRSDSDSDKSRTQKATDKPTFNNRSKNQASSNFRKRRVDSSDSDSSPKPRDNTRKHRARSPEDLSRSRHHKTRSRHHKPRSSTDKKSRSSHHEVGEKTGRRRTRSRSRSPNHKTSKSSGSRRRVSKSISVSPEQESTQRRKRSLSTERPTNEIREKSRNSVSGDSKYKSDEAPRVDYDEIDLEENLKDMRQQSDQAEKSVKENRSGEKSSKENGQASKAVIENGQIKVSPSKKVYPHHNSVKDIQDARKRYLQRKLERERTYVA